MYMSFGYDLWWIEELVAQLVVVLHILVSIEGEASKAAVLKVS